MTDPLAPTGLVPDDLRTVAEQLRSNAATRGDTPALVSLEDGKAKSINDYRGKKIVLHIWASW